MKKKHYCSECEHHFTNARCPRCGGPPDKAFEAQHHDQVDAQHHDQVDALLEGEALSEDDDSLDSMIEQASIPTLASLLKRGIESGLIKPTPEYGGGVKA